MKTSIHASLATLCLMLASCAGYQLGGQKPASLTGVETIAVPMFANATQHPRASALATSAVAEAMIRDGTYRIVEADRADAILDGRLERIPPHNGLNGARELRCLIAIHPSQGRLWL